MRVAVIEPSEAVARQVRRVLDAEAHAARADGGGGVRYLTSGDDAAFAAVRERLRAAGRICRHRRSTRQRSTLQLHRPTCPYTSSGKRLIVPRKLEARVGAQRQPALHRPRSRSRR